MKQRSEILLTQLCDEIDFLKEEVEYWKSKYEQEKQERWDEFKKEEKRLQKGVANALMFALSVREDENGNLVIPKEERKQLAENWK